MNYGQKLTILKRKWSMIWKTTETRMKQKYKTKWKATATD
jgi:hypothetical protein